MPFPAVPGNPNVFPQALPSWLQPYAQFPGGQSLMKDWVDGLKREPWNAQPGFQQIPYQYPTSPYGMLATPVADIYSFTKKGLLGVPGTEGAGGRGLGSRGGGLLGGRYNFRDPSSVAQYELDQGIKPGSLQPVAPRSAEVKQMPPGPRADGYVHATDVLRWAKQNNIPQDKALQMANDRATAGPTPAQMARPVKQTPEISAKLKDARFARWAIGHAGPHWKNLSPEQLTALRTAWEQVHGGK